MNIKIHTNNSLRYLKSALYPAKHPHKHENFLCQFSINLSKYL